MTKGITCIFGCFLGSEDAHKECCYNNSFSCPPYFFSTWFESIGGVTRLCYRVGSIPDRIELEFSIMKLILDRVCSVD